MPGFDNLTLKNNRFSAYVYDFLGNDILTINNFAIVAILPITVGIIGFLLAIHPPVG